jgi:hypothetical protein
VTFGCGSGCGSPDPYLWLIDQDPDSDTTPDPIPFFSDFKNAKKILFRVFFLKPSILKIKFLFGKHFLSPLNTYGI